MGSVHYSSRTAGGGSYVPPVQMPTVMQPQAGQGMASQRS